MTHIEQMMLGLCNCLTGFESSGPIIWGRYLMRVSSESAGKAGWVSELWMYAREDR